MAALIHCYREGYVLDGTHERNGNARCVRWKQNTNVPEVRGERVTPLRRCLFPDRLEYVNAAGAKRDPLKYAAVRHARFRRFTFRRVDNIR